MDLSLEEWQALIPLPSSSVRTKLDISFVLDTTGSMGDELNYLQVEIANIAQTIQARFPDLEQRYAVIPFRDNGDEYLTRNSGFLSDIGAFQAFLNEQSAAGGGDTPEALEQGLAEASANLNWGAEDTSKILFLITDAPPHENNEAPSFEQLLALKERNIKIYPLGASGMDQKVELIMRIAALISGAQYLFLTDDSGVGNPHLEPSIPCYHVEKLSDLMIRVINSEVTNQTIWPEAEKIIRTVGNPSDGLCLE